jgi:hypothetical protein
MKDQAPRQRFLDANNRLIEMIFVASLAFISGMLVIYILWDFLVVPPVATPTAYNHAISPELQSYINGPGKGVFINEGGLE